MSVLSHALTVTRSFVHQATGKHTLLLTSKACSKRSTSFPAKPTKPKCPRVTYLFLTSTCRSPFSSLTMVRADVDRYMYIWFLSFLFLFCLCTKQNKIFFAWKSTCHLFTCYLTGLIPSQNPRLAFQQYLEVVGNDRPYKCQYCNKAYKKSSHLKQHVR